MQKKWLKSLQKDPENGPKACIFRNLMWESSLLNVA